MYSYSRNVDGDVDVDLASILVMMMMMMMTMTMMGRFVRPSPLGAMTGGPKVGNTHYVIVLDAQGYFHMKIRP